MMGAHHAACGAAAWVALTTRIEIDPAPWAAQLLPPGGTIPLGFGLLEVSDLGVVTGALVTAGAALVPDADHHNASIAHSLPPLSNLLCAGIGTISGGHRHGSHSIIGLIAFTAAALAAGLWTVHVPGLGVVYPGAGLLSVLLIAFAAKALKIIPDRMRASPWTVGLSLGVFIALFAPEQRFWFPLAMAAGVVVHILGDMLTTGGCNLLWPARVKPPAAIAALPLVNRIFRPNGYLAIPVLGNAGSLREWALLVPVGLYAVAGVGASLVHIGQESFTTLAALSGW
ncbi:metal-dependent hydrolase [Arthrobacter castelli]|uniref:metal-dependent hydrolase n=1 Tax=Arthrobacter castelli TaxID=271431 RepID=UPI0004117809|nr:metal-dependent hydrolase [Arthrobacter castelli]